MTPLVAQEHPTDIAHDAVDVFIRDLHPDDERLYADFHANVSASDRRLRFFSAAPLSARQIHRLTHFDVRHAIARAAIGVGDGKLYGVARIHRIGEDVGEFAVMVRSDVKGRGLGRRLLEDVIAGASAIGVRRIDGLILAGNEGMLALARELGFGLSPEPNEAGILRASLDRGSTSTPLAA